MPKAAGIKVKDVMSVEVIAPKPLTGAELSKRWPLDEVARRGGGVLNTLEGTRAQLKFHPKAGFIELEFRGAKFTVHKDELLYFARMAKGNMAV